MIFAHPSIEEESGVVAIGYSDSRTDEQRARDNRLLATATVTVTPLSVHTDTPMVRYLAPGPWVISEAPTGEPVKRKGPKDSTHVPFYRNLPKFKRRR